MPTPEEVKLAEERARQHEREQAKREQARKDLEELRRKQRQPDYRHPVARSRARD